MKYVMFKRVMREGTQFVPVVFSTTLVHAEVAEAMLAGPLKGFEVHSAGELSSIVGEAYGRSSTLMVEADPEDTRRLLMADYSSFE